MNPAVADLVGNANVVPRRQRSRDERYRDDDAGGARSSLRSRQAPPYYYAEEYHPHYLATRPDGYRCHSATGVKVPR